LEDIEKTNGRRATIVSEEEAMTPDGKIKEKTYADGRVTYYYKSIGIQNEADLADWIYRVFTARTTEAECIRFYADPKWPETESNEVVAEFRMPETKENLLKIFLFVEAGRAEVVGVFGGVPAVAGVDIRHVWTYISVEEEHFKDLKKLKNIIKPMYTQGKLQI